MKNELTAKLRLYAEQYDRPPYGREIAGTKELLKEAADAIEEMAKNSRTPESSLQGKWIIVSDGYYPVCSQCQTEPVGGKLSKYCPHCGAKMVAPTTQGIK